MHINVLYAQIFFKALQDMASFYSPSWLFFLLPRMEMQTRAYTTTESDFDKPYENLREKPCETKNKIHKNTVENITKQGKTYRIFRYIVKQELPNQLKHPKQIVHVL